LGKIKRKELLQKEFGIPKAPIHCTLCLREIPKTQMEAHHLVPKSKEQPGKLYLPEKVLTQDFKRSEPIYFSLNQYMNTKTARARVSV